MSSNNKYKVCVISLSTRAFNGIYEDKSGKYLVDFLKGYDFEMSYHLISDDALKLEELLIEESEKVDVIITTGGTGITEDDITVGVVEKIMDYEIRGMSIALHQFNLQVSPGNMFSRALSAIYNRTIVLTLPGSYKAANEIMPYFIDYLNHGLKHLKNQKPNKKY